MRTVSPWVVVLTWLLASPLGAQVWNPLPGADPTRARFNHAGAYDFLRDRLVVFGGESSSSILGDTLEHDGTRWTTMSTPVAPSARLAHGMAFDVGRARVVLFGGQDAAGVIVNDTWEWDGSVWQQIPTAVAPTPRMGLAMTADLWRGGVVVHGGHTNLAFVFGDLWHWTGGQWLLDDGSGPPRCAHAMAIDPHNGELVLFGGWNGVTCGDLWLWNGSWRQASVAGPSPRWGHRMASDFVRNRVVLSGGYVDGASNGETWVFDGQRWFRLGDGPARYNHVLDQDISRGRCVEAGGLYCGVLDAWSFGAAAAGTIQPFGQGCGSSSTPTLAAVNAPRLGTTLQLSTSSTIAATTYLLGFSATSTNANTLALPVDLTQYGATGCVLYVDPDRIDVAVPVAGS